MLVPPCATSRSRRDAEGRVGGHAAVAVGAAAVGAEDEVLRGQLHAPHVVDARQQLGDGLHAGLDRLADAAALLDGQRQRRASSCR